MYPNRADLFRNYPELEPDDIQQALAFAAANLEDSATRNTCCLIDTNRHATDLRAYGVTTR
jgi:hypothetical protein